MKIATWNVNGIRARQAQFLDWIEGERPDVVCLQELKATPEQLAFDLRDLEGYYCFWHGSGPQSGVSIHVRRDNREVEPLYSHPTFDRQTRIVEAHFDNLSVVSMYVPNGGKDFNDKMLFLREFREWMAAQSKTTELLVVCGDMNVTRDDRDLHPKERNPKAIGQRPEERLLFEDILEEGLVDLVRQFHPEDYDFFTWWAPWRNNRERNIGWRLDYVMASEALAARATACPVQATVGTSDHAPVMATFA